MTQIKTTHYSSKFKLDYTDNLLLNMTAGLLPKNLNKEEIKALEERFGQDWFEKLGYDSTYERPLNQ